VISAVNAPAARLDARRGEPVRAFVERAARA